MRPFLYCIASCLLLCILSCTKNSAAIKTIITPGFYTPLPVTSIEVQSILYPLGVVWDTVYAPHAGDNIDFSTKGIIDFNISGDQHTDTYDTLKYSVYTDTLINVNPGNPGFNYISLVRDGTGGIIVKESSFGIDAGTAISYNLKK